MTDTSPAEGHTTVSAAAGLRVFLFERESGAREVPEAELERHARPSDQQLLWVDVTADAPPERLRMLGLDPATLELKKGGAIGLFVGAEWKLLFVRALNWHRPSERPVASLLTLALGRNVLVSLRRGDVDFIDEVLDDEADHLRVGRLESTVFAMALLDRMLTDYLDARDAFETALDRLELMILSRPRSRHLVELQALRRRASTMRRHLAAQRDLFDALARPDFDPGQSEEAASACRLIGTRYDRVMDSVEGARELVNGSFDLYTSRTAESTNHAMHTLTVVTVVMGLAATIAGVLGMNFKSPVFDTGPRGFLVALSVIGALVVGSAAWALLRLRRERRATSSS